MTSIGVVVSESISCKGQSSPDVCLRSTYLSSIAPIKVWECFDVFQLVALDIDGIALLAIQAHGLGFAGVNAKPNNLSRIVEAGCFFLHVALFAY